MTVPIHRHRDVRCVGVILPRFADEKSLATTIEPGIVPKSLEIEGSTFVRLGNRNERHPHDIHASVTP